MSLLARDSQETRRLAADNSVCLQQGAELVGTIEVMMDTGPNADGCRVASSLPRELQFLLSHTVHHYALIATMNAVAGVETPEDFGVAPSTLVYRRNNRR